MPNEEGQAERKKSKFFGGYVDEPFHKPPAESDQGKSQGGRPPVFDQFAKAKVSAMIAAGVSQRTAADYLNIHPSTISKAIKRDPHFKKEIVHAQAAARVLPLLNIRRASDKSWRAAVWMLEHGQPTTDLSQREAQKNQRRESRQFAQDGVQWVESVGDELQQCETEEPSPNGGDEVKRSAAVTPNDDYLLGG